MSVLELANVIIEKNHFTISEAWCHAWRILNEYPIEFRLAALAISRGENTDISVNEMKLTDIENLSGKKDFEALELLRIYAKDCVEAKNIIFTLGIHDSLV